MRAWVCTTALIAAMAGPALADDAESCFSDLALLRLEPSAVVVACHNLAERGDAKAQNQLGVMHAEGWLAPKDNSLAVAWYRKAAAQGFATAQANLAFMYLWGLGVAQDDEMAYVWATLAEEGGNPRAARLLDTARSHLTVMNLVTAEKRLGDMYAKGDDIAKDETKAAQWYGRAAYGGFAPAQLELARRYASGAGIARDDPKAYFWASLAADSGIEEAAALRRGIVPRLTSAQLAASQYELGVVYDEGRLAPLVPVDYAKAAALYHQAANLGNAKAQSGLGGMYQTGHGVPQDLVKAYIWYRIAASGGVSDPCSRETMTKLTPEQIAAADALVRAWRPQASQ